MVAKQDPAAAAGENYLPSLEDPPVDPHCFLPEESREKDLKDVTVRIWDEDTERYI